MAATEGAEKLQVAAEQLRKAVGWAARNSSGVLSPFSFTRRATGDDDVVIKILYCGICHSDLHMIKNDWNNTVFPIVRGHEIVGIAIEVGSNVHKFKVGDKVGVGCLVNSCRTCESCNQSLENYCPKKKFTYGSSDVGGMRTYGGYSNIVIVDERFVVLLPENLPLDKGAPLLCAGITVYSPMKSFGLDKPGKHLGVVGLGGLGHVAVKFAKSFGMKVTVISSSPSKEREGIVSFGANAFLVRSNPEQMQSAIGTMDGIIDTVSAAHQIAPLISLLKTQGKMIMVGAPNCPLELPIFPLIMGGKTLAGSSIGGMEETQEMGGKTLAGSSIGGMEETQEMINFAGKHNIAADIELISMDYVNEAMKRLAKGDVRYRFVIDVANTLTVESGEGM